jgi:spore coat protein JB
MIKRDNNKNENIKTSLLKKIMQLQFAVIETVLYLDTHPFDENVLNLYNQYSSRLRNSIRKYSENYGPLTPTCPDTDSPWSWIDEPWPWQIDY